MNNFDQQVTEEMNIRTANDTAGLKDDIWSGLEKELFNKETKKIKRKSLTISSIGIIAAGLLIAFSLHTDTGSALIKGIKDLFVPEKEIIQGIEGQDEETEVTLNEGADSNYVIYIDETRYKMANGEEADIITTIEPLPEKYPEVSMEIIQVADKKPEVLVQELEAEFKIDFPELREIEAVTEPVEGFLLHGLNGNSWDAKVVHAYVISNGKEGSFIIKENYFLEAAEGHGARFHHMLTTFEIVE